MDEFNSRYASRERRYFLRDTFVCARAGARVRACASVRRQEMRGCAINYYTVRRGDEGEKRVRKKGRNSRANSCRVIDARYYNSFRITKRALPDPKLAFCSTQPNLDHLTVTARSKFDAWRSPSPILHDPRQIAN